MALPLSFAHLEFYALFRLPVYCLSALLIGTSIDRHPICHHKSRVKAQTKMPDDLILICLVLVLLQKTLRTGKGDLIDVGFYFVCGHTNSVIDKGQCLFFGVGNHINPVLLPFRRFIFAHQRKLFQFSNRITTIGNHFTDKNIVIRIQPLFNNRKNIFGSNG